MFRKMLKSIDNQQLQVPLFVSVSIANVALNNEILDIAKQYPNFTFFIQDKCFTQFEHYAFLAKALSYDSYKTWCLFTDDDDISNVNRTKVFMKHINTVKDNIDIVRDTSVRTKYTNHLETKGVDDESDDAIVQDFIQPANEYIVNACKLAILQEFCRKASKSTLLTMTGCDMIFGAWITTTKQNSATFHSDNWLYEYTIRPNTNRSIASSEGSLLIKVDFSVFD